MLSEQQIDELLRKKNVVGASQKLKPKRVNGKETTEMSVRIYVEKKESLKNLSVSDLVPNRIAEYKTDIVELGPVNALNLIDNSIKAKIKRFFSMGVNRMKKFRPIPCGVSEANVEGTAGTKGINIIIDDISTAYDGRYGQLSTVPMGLKPGVLYSLSNAHVYCEDTRKGVSQQERRISQPGPYDNSDWRANLAKELKSHVLIQPGKKNWLDCAVAENYRQEDESTTILEIGDPTGVAEQFEGQKIIKSGRTTGVNTGEVRDTSAVIRVNYGEFAATFYDVCICSPMLNPGDSGSAILEQDTNRVIGLGFAGSSQSSIFCKIQSILRVYGARVATGEVMPPEPPETPEDNVAEVHFIVERDGSSELETGEIRGNVKEKRVLKPVGDAEMTIKLKDADLSIGSKTDIGGLFNFSNIKLGTYLVSFKKEGFKSTSKEVVLL